MTHASSVSCHTLSFTNYLFILNVESKFVCVLMQGKANPLDVDVGVEVFATMNLKTTLEISCPESKSGIGGHWVDDTVSFSSLERSKANVDATTCALPFDDSSKSCQSVLGEKPEKPKMAIFQSSKVITVSFRKKNRFFRI